MKKHINNQNMMKKNYFGIKKITVLSVAAMLAACQAVGPNYVRPQSELPAQYLEASSAESQNNLQQWWMLFEDATLNSLVDQALKNHTDVQYAVARIEEANAYAREVGAATLPSVDFDAGASRSRVTETGANPVSNNPRSNYNYQFSSSFEIDFWGKIRRAKESARAQLLSSKYAKETVTWTLSSQVARNYLALRSVEAQLTIAQNNLKSRDESLALTKRRFEGGVSSKLDVHQAEVASANLAADIAELNRQRAIYAHQLATLTGKLDLALASSNGAQLPVPPTPPAGLPSSLLENRPDVRQAEEQLVAMNANIGFAKAALYPTISLTGILGGESLELSDVLKSASRIWTAGLDISIPVFNSGRLSARVEQASAKQKQALAQYQSSVRSAFQEVNDALVSARQHAERENALNQSAEAAKNALQISENRYRDGYSSYLEVLDAQRVYNDAERNAALAREARLIATVDLFKSLGGGWNKTD